MSAPYKLRRMVKKARLQHHTYLLYRRLGLGDFAFLEQRRRDETLRRARAMQKSLREVQP
ncbi:hypothetical protein ACSBPQ_07755 [Stenotrophomonas sp. JC08]|uniref:hypothetical protein n=1 Tax=Stenotrophomonas sp. JC08 TaxID=3445779 RepID=UPI003FA33A59